MGDRLVAGHAQAAAEASGRGNGGSGHRNVDINDAIAAVRNDGIHSRRGPMAMLQQVAMSVRLEFTSASKCWTSCRWSPTTSAASVGLDDDAHALGGRGDSRVGHQCDQARQPQRRDQARVRRFRERAGRGCARSARSACATRAPGSTPIAGRSARLRKTC